MEMTVSAALPILPRMDKVDYWDAHGLDTLLKMEISATNQKIDISAKSDQMVANTHSVHILLATHQKTNKNK